MVGGVSSIGSLAPLPRAMGSDPAAAAAWAPMGTCGVSRAGLTPPGTVWPSRAWRTRWPSTAHIARLGGGGPAAGVAVAPVVEGVEVDRHAGHGQPADGVQQGGHPVPAGPVGGHGQVGLARQRALDQAGEHPPGPDLDEHPHAGLVHGLDLVGEPHALGDLPGDQLAGAGRRSSGYGAAVVLDHTGTAGGPEVDVGQVAAEPVGGPGHDRAVEGAGDGDALGADPVVLEQRHGRVDGGGRAGDDHLLGVVVVGDHHVAALDERLDLVALGGRGGGHGAGVVAGGLEDGLGPRLGQRQQGGLVDRARPRQGDQLAVAVAAGSSGRDAQLARAPWPRSARRCPGPAGRRGCR